MKILWVEDNERFVRLGCQQFLATHEVQHATTLVMARIALREQDFDVVLLDYDLPDGKGDALLPDIFEHGSPFVIAASSHERGNEILRLSGAHAVCAKLQFQALPGILGNLDLNS